MLSPELYAIADTLASDIEQGRSDFNAFTEWFNAQTFTPEEREEILDMFADVNYAIAKRNYISERKVRRMMRK